MKNTRILISLIVLVCIAATFAFAACEPTMPPPGHVCRHLCATCNKCTDTACSDPECADKCQGHEVVEEHKCDNYCSECGKCLTTDCEHEVCADKCQGHTDDGGDDEHECSQPCPECGGCLDDDCNDDACQPKCDCDDGDDDNNDPTPPAADITEPFNGAILHKGANTVGELYLLQDGSGLLTLSNPNSSFSGNFVECEITYTLINGQFKIWTADDATVKTPVTGTVQGRTVSITLEKTLNGVASSYEFSSELNKVTLVNQLGKNESSIWYLPEGYKEDITASRDGYTLDKVVVNGVDKSASWLNNFVAPNQDVTIEYVWSIIEHTGNYTIIYQANNGTGQTYVDHSTSDVYTLLSLYAMTSPEDEDTEPEYLMNFDIPEGKYFAGWLVNGTTKVSNMATITLTEEETIVTAQWASNILVTLTGLNVSGVYSNLEINHWEGSCAEGYTQQFTSSYNFYLPNESSQFISVAYVAREGFVLVGWKCSIHNEIHAPGSKHALTEDVTFEAQWKLDVGVTDFEGSYTATTPLDLSDWKLGPYVRATVSGRTLTLYDEDGDAKVVQLSVSGNTATGEQGLWKYTLTLDGDTLTISVTRGSVGSPIVGVFTKRS